MSTLRQPAARAALTAPSSFGSARRRAAPVPITAAETLAGWSGEADDLAAYATAVEALAPAQRIEALRAGIPARVLSGLADALLLPRERLAQYLGIARSTLAAKLAQDGALDRAQTERVVGLLRLVALARRMLDESGDPREAQGFDLPAWLGHWLRTPVPALGGGLPAELLDTAEGAAIVAGLLAQMQSGAYA